MDPTAYLRRLGLPAAFATAPPSAENLFALHRAHVERVAYEAIDVQLGVVCSIAAADSYARISSATLGRGGYCYVLNGAFSELLAALGYDVVWHRAGVQGSPHVEPGSWHANHLALTVHGAGGDWFVDAGLGDALHEPLPLRAGTYRQGPFTYRLRPSESDPGGWRFDHDPGGAFVGMDFSMQRATVDDFQERHEWLSTSPESGFVRMCAVQRRDAGGVDTIRGLVLRRWDAAGDREVAVLESPEAWYGALRDVFGLTLGALSAEERDGLWHRVRAAHEAWLAASAT